MFIFALYFLFSYCFSISDPVDEEDDTSKLSSSPFLIG
jgi:hypothetical protein